MKIICIIPAYNEEKTIAKVIKTVKEVELIEKIIVVSDGSDDDTAKIASSMGAYTIEYKENKGKGSALKTGICNAEADLLLFLDADLIGLSKDHILALLDPVIDDEADMTVGIFCSGRLATDLAQKITPSLSGQRAIKKGVLDKIGDINLTGYGVEVALTKFVERENYRIKTVELKDMTHVMKEEKLGLTKGIAARMKMYWEIAKCFKL